MRKIMLLVLSLQTWVGWAQLLTPDELQTKPTYRAWPDEPIEQIYRVTLENPGALPADIDRYTQLQSLSVFGNDWDYDFNSLPDNFYKLPNLQLFIVSNTNLARLSDAIGEMRNLQWLSVSGNAVKTLPDALAKCPTLTRLVIDNMPEVPYVPSLRELYIGFGADSVVLPVGLEKYATLDKLALVGNPGNYDPNEIGKLLNKLPNIRSFMFNNPYQDDRSLIFNLMKFVKNSKNIKELTLSSLSIESSAMDLLSNIEVLSADYVECLDDESGKACFEALGKLPNLKEFSCNYSEYNVDLYPLVPSLSLFMDNWYQDGYTVFSHIERIKSLKNLKKLTSAGFSGNFSELESVEELDLLRVGAIQDLGEFFTILSKMSKLRKLTVSANYIQEFPAETAKLTKLQEMVVYNYSHGIFSAQTEAEKDRVRKMLPHCKFTFIEQ